MKRLHVLASVLLGIYAPCLSHAQSSLVLKNVNIVGLAGEVDHNDRDVLLQGNKIVSLRATSTKTPSEARVVDCSNKWLIPGLIDMRATLQEGGADRQQELQEQLAAGITAILDLSGSSSKLAADAMAPRIFASTAPFRGNALAWSSGGIILANDKAARQAVQSAKQQGASLLFLDANLEAGTVKAILKEASTSGLLTSGAFLATSFEDASRGGVNMIFGMASLLSGFADGGERKNFSAHWSRAEEALFSAEYLKAWQKLDPQKNARKKLQQLTNQAVFFVPNLALESKLLVEAAPTSDSLQAQALFRKQQQLLRLAFELQVPLLAGSGYHAARYWRPTLHDELEAWVAAGIEPRFALEAATINAGHALRQTNIGQISEGMLADLVLLEEHPLKKLSALRRPWAVITNGNFIAQEQLAQMRTPHRIAQREIRAVLAWQVQAWNEGDLVRFMRGYWKNDSTVFASGGQVSHGWGEMLARYQRGYPTREKMGQLEFKIYKVEMMGDTWAKVLGQWKLVIGTTTPQGLFTLVLRRFEEGWRIVHDHTSSVAP